MLNKIPKKWMVIGLIAIIVTAIIISLSFTWASKLNTEPEVTPEVKSEPTPQSNSEIIIEGVQNNAMTTQSKSADDSHLTITRNGMNGQHYELSLNDTLQLGDQIETADYIYTFGYSYTGTGSAAKGSLNGWTLTNKQEWGVRVKNTAKASYSDVYSILCDYPVTDMRGTFLNCTSMKNLPVISHNVTNTYRMCYNCSKLETAVIPNGTTTLSDNTFENCPVIKMIYIPKSVITITKSPMVYNCSKTLRIFIEHDATNLPSDWPSNWNYNGNVGTISYMDKFTLQEFDVLMHDGYVVHWGDKITK